MSKKRNRHLRRALELACDEIDRISHGSVDFQEIQAARANEPEYYLALACSGKDKVVISDDKHTTV